MRRMSEGPPGSCCSTGAESCRACRSQLPHSCWESRAPLSRRGNHPVWRAYLAKRSQLVADLADQVQDHTCQGDAPPVWAPSASHPSTALVREIAVWRAANGVNPQDPRPTGGTQLETPHALWKQRLDRDIARATDPPADARADERQAGTHHTQSLARRQAAPIPNTRTASERASRTPPLTPREAAALKLLFARCSHGTQPSQLP
jgi:hypothetical protein